MWIINGSLVLVLAGTVTAAVLSVGDPSTASTATTRTTKVARGTVTATVSASGNLASQTSVGVDFSGSGGTLTAIYVKVGQVVAKGQALAKVDDTSANQSLQSAQASLTSAQAQYDTTVQGQTSQERARDQASIRSAEVSLANAKTSLTQAKVARALDKKQQDATVASAQAAVDKAQDATTKATAQSSLTQAKNTRDTTLLKDDQQIENQEGQVRSAQAALNSQKASAAANAQPAKRGSVASATAQVTSAQVQVAQAQTTVDQTVLRAPVAGTVASVSGVIGESSTGTGTSGSGNTSGSGTTGSTGSSSSTSGFVVLTDLSGLQVTTQVAEADANRVSVGQSATITFSAANLTAKGSVTAIDVQDNVSNNVVQYGVTVTLTDPPAGLKLGQTATVSITTGTKQNVLEVASSAITTAGGVSTVTVRRNGKDSTVPVETGLAGDALTEIVSGLSEGDEVVLPTSTGGSGSGGFTFPGGGAPGGLGGGLGGGAGS
jgi:multidrug efflux pump subunit AcrA (membrane-fusion protein)